ncbi:CRISPR-associated protein Cas4 [Methylohalobius crimeensis]|uniref:CRISPR-associated protein Cas4 n=1 Tax=Methylohalobius crimeensis TaxID=244365 RepID=UPI000428D185|nr:CRISPR-associated protein Cas4 [Methylohalobius crimeensis]
MDDYLAISALQHYAYCPRQFALIHIEQAWSENRLTAEGRLLHERVDAGYAEQRRGVRYERGVLLVSHQLGLTGKADLIEVHSPNEGKQESPRYFPVEYKRGRPKIEDWDRIQLCAQALCIEEMRNTQVTEGAIWYWQVRRRKPVIIDAALRQTTLDVIEAARRMLLSGETPPPIDERRRCKACSLAELCNPKAFARDRSVSYVNAIFQESDDPSEDSQE